MECELERMLSTSYMYLIHVGDGVFTLEKIWVEGLAGTNYHVDVHVCITSWQVMNHIHFETCINSATTCTAALFSSPAGV